jgi:hypothetical protein
MEAATRHEFDLMLFWSLDRFSREGDLSDRYLPEAGFLIHPSLVLRKLKGSLTNTGRFP